ncbi:MAG TPA: sulfatase-like hydrolase/transferase [Kiritimatiellia bacterium]|nr:sulfatase-like hydrolase/transferase [Kiritimatiellia bacterium]
MRSLLCIGVIAPLLTGAAFAQPTSRVARPPNIVLILADDMGYSDPGYMGGEAATPNLDRLARDGVTFLNCFNNAKCAPSRAALMTGMNAVRVKAFRSKGNIRDNHAASMAEVLGARGYVTILAGKWHIAPDPWEVGFQHQFGSQITPYYFRPGPAGKRGGLMRNGQPVDHAALPDDWYSTIAYTDFAMESIREAALPVQKPFFLFLSYHAPHAPLSALEEDLAKYRGRYDEGTDAAAQRRYERMVEKGIVDPAIWSLPPQEKHGSWREGNEPPRWKDFSDREKALFQRKLELTAAMVDRMDREIGRLLAFLEETGELERTLIIFLSDNGATHEMGVYGGVDMERLTDASLAQLGLRNGPAGGTAGPVVARVQNVPLRGYKTTLWDGGMRSSMIVHGPGVRAASNGFVRTPVDIIDLAPTFYEVAGAEYPATIGTRSLLPMDGVSLVPLLKGEPLPSRELFHAYKEDHVVRNERWKLFGRYNQRKQDHRWQLFDLQADPAELKDVADRHPDVVSSLAAQWQAWNLKHGVIAGYQAYRAGKEDRDEE